MCCQAGCVKECKEDEFLCLNHAHCIPRRWRCDDIFDCVDHSDEENCSQGTTGLDILTKHASVLENYWFSIQVHLNFLNTQATCPTTVETCISNICSH